MVFKKKDMKGMKKADPEKDKDAKTKPKKKK